MKRLSAILILVPAILLAGCARTPSGFTPTTIREMSFTIDFDGPISDDYFYYVAIDTNGGDDGPVPVFPGLGIVGEGWVTGSADYFIQYRARQYTVNRITSLDPLRSEPIGPPIRSTAPEIGGTTLSFTIDLNEIGATGPSVDINIISVSDPNDADRVIDGLGLGGTQFLGEVNITQDRTFTNEEDSTQPETAADVLNKNQQIIDPQPTPQTSPLDITDWSITTDV